MKTEVYKYTVKSEDNLWTILKNEGFDPRDWNAIYKADYNTRFRSDHRNPHVIQPKAVLYLPKHKKSDLLQTVKKLKLLERAAKDLVERRQKLSKSVKALEKVGHVELKRVQELEREIATVDRIQEDCESTQDPLAAGMCSFQFGMRRKSFNAELSTLKKGAKQVDKEKKKALASLTKKLAKAEDEAKAYARLISGTKKDAEKIAKSPY